MRIGLVIYGSLDTLSGGYLYDRKLVAYLRSCADTVEILSLPWRSYPRHLLDNLDSTWRRRLAGLDVDVLLQDELNHPSLAWANRLYRNASFPVVSIVHHLRSSEQHPAWQLPIHRFVEQRYLATLDGFVYNSRTTRDSVTSLLKRTVVDADFEDTQVHNSPQSVPSGQSVHNSPQSVPSGQSVSNSAPHGIVAYPAANHLDIPGAEGVKQLIVARRIRPGPVEILFVGNLISRKGLHHLLTALAHLRQRNWRLHVIGSTEVDPGYTAHIRALIEQLGLDVGVTLHGKVDDTTLAKHLALSHLLAVPSYEGFGIVYLEAMAFGLPVIASTAGAAHEIVQPGVNGFLVEPNDTDGLVQTLACCLGDRNRLAEMGSAARRVFDSHPTWAETGARIRGYLVDICAAHGTSKEI